MQEFVNNSRECTIQENVGRKEDDERRGTVIWMEVVKLIEDQENCSILYS